MGTMSRSKGARGELEVQELARAHGFTSCRRAFASGASGGGDLTGIPGVHVEVKRTERLNLPAAFRQAQAAAERGETPMVAHRSNGQPWLATVPLDDLLALLALAQS